MLLVSQQVSVSVANTQSDQNVTLTNRSNMNRGLLQQDSH